MQKEQNEVSGVFDSVFIKKVVKSRKSYLIWIPKDEAEYLDIKENSFVRVGLKKLKNDKTKS